MVRMKGLSSSFISRVQAYNAWETLVLILPSPEACLHHRGSLGCEQMQSTKSIASLFNSTPNPMVCQQQSEHPYIWVTGDEV
jgi:hypothetical protein